MSNIQYIRPQPVHGSIPQSNSKLVYNRNAAQLTTGRNSMAQEYQQLDPQLKQELSQTVNELSQSMSNNNEALVQCQKLLNSKSSMDPRRVKEWHEGVRNNVRNFNKQNARQVSNLKNIGAFNSSEHAKIDQISKNIDPNPKMMSPSELQRKLNELNSLIGVSKHDMNNSQLLSSHVDPRSSNRRSSYRAKVNVENQAADGSSLHTRQSTSYLRPKNSSHHQAPPRIEKVQIVSQDAPVVKHPREKTPVRHRVHVDPLINLTPIRRPAQRKNPKREIIKEVSKSQMNNMSYSNYQQVQQKPSTGSPQNWIAHQQQNQPSIDRNSQSNNFMQQSTTLKGSQLPIQVISGRSTVVQSGVQTPIEEPVFIENLVNGELVSLFLIFWSLISLENERNQ